MWRLLSALTLSISADGSPAVAQEVSPPLPAQGTNILVPVDGANMSLHLSGGGRVAIILEAGSGGDHRTWAQVQPPLSRLGRVISYDRLDYGHSGRSPRPRSASVVAEQLREGLRQAGVSPPYLLVGHSYGGAIARVFASRYPQEVIGLVLVDPAMEDFYVRATVDAPADYLQGLEEALAFDDREASPALRREYLAYETSMLQARLSTPIPGDRIILISAAQQLASSPSLQRLWLDSQRQWAERVGARHVVVDSAHHVPRLNPAAVVRAIESLVSP